MMMLEKVEIGGIRGNQLSSQVVAIYEEFLELHAKQSAVTYDALDPEGKEFLVDYEHFKVRYKTSKGVSDYKIPKLRYRDMKWGFIPFIFNLLN